MQVSVARARAAEYAARAEEAYDEHSRELFTAIRDSWQRVAESWELMDALETKVPSVSAPLPGILDLLISA